MTDNRSRFHGQATAEFAIAIIALLMLMFVIVDAARIGWAWVTVQNAARSGARYASTGNANCNQPPDRLACIINTTHNTLDTLPLLDDPEAPWGADNAYRIEVWGIDAQGLGPWQNDPGAAGRPVVVRAYYWVPIVTPLLRPIQKTVRVLGQVTMTNELFDSLGGSSAGVGLPPPVPVIPAAAPTDTPTPTPTSTNTPTASPTLTPSQTPTATDTPLPQFCDTQFEPPLIVGDNSVRVTGNLDTPFSNVEIYNLSDTDALGLPKFLGSAMLSGPTSGHACPAFVVVPVSEPLTAGHIIKVENTNDGTWDTEVVLPGTPTATPTSTSTPTSTPTPSPTVTPQTPYIQVAPVCGSGSPTSFTVSGSNWTDSTKAINIFWIEAGQQPKLQMIIPVGHASDFMSSWQLGDVNPGTHQVEARSGSIVQSVIFEVPCAVQPDLVISDPILVNPPLTEYAPFDVAFLITNTGGVDINQHFFVDIFLDPAQVYTTTIPINQSAAYRAVSGLAAGGSKSITVRAPSGFGSGINGSHQIYGMSDSMHQVDEVNESNNIGGPYNLTIQSGVPTSTPAPLPGGSHRIRGIVHTITSYGTFGQQRAQVWLVRSSDGAIVSMTTSDSSANYDFTNVASDTYQVWACMPLDDAVYVGNRVGVISPDLLADIFMTEDQAGCPY